MPLEINQQTQGPQPKQPKVTAAQMKAQESSAAKGEAITLEEEKIYRHGVMDIKDLISPAAFEVKPTYLILGDIYCPNIFCFELSSLY